MGMVFDDFRLPSSGLQRNQWCTFSRPAVAAFLPIWHRANDQRLCLPRIPAFVRCFSMEDLLNTRSRVICSSFVSLE